MAQVPTPLEAVRTGVWADRRLRYDGTAEAPIGRSPVGGFGWSIYFYLLFSSLPFTFYSCFIPFLFYYAGSDFFGGGDVCLVRGAGAGTYVGGDGGY